MKRLLIPTILSVVFAVSSPAAETILQEFSWPDMARAKQVLADAVVTLPDGSVALKAENPVSGPMTATLFVIDAPKITTDFYAISGEVRYDDVAGDGFLEMWNHFGEAAYFSRTMAEFGPLAKLRGTSDWRPFTLPFNATGAKSHPTKLVINIHLPGKGTVFLRKVKLTEATSFNGLSGMGGFGGVGQAWRSAAGPGLAGGIAGAVIGCLASLMEWCASRGKGRGFVLATCKTLIGVGAVAVAWAAAATLSGRPYHVWYPVLLLGVLCVLIFPFRLRRYHDQYRSGELRRMSALDAA